MSLFVLDYDLRKQRNYQTLYDALSTFDAIRILESTWCFKRFNTNSAGLRDHFKQFIDADDGLWIAEVTNWATHRTLANPSQLK
jgi:hypothetical protein